MKFDPSFFKKLYYCEKRITIPTLFTLSRIILVPFIVISIINQHWTSAFIFFLLAALTDIIDGGLARLCNNKTTLGACLDPLADKLLLTAVFVTLAYIHTPLFPVPSWFALLIICRESAILFGSLILLVRGTSFTIAPTKLGKLTTTVQITFITWLFLCYFLGWAPTKTYHFLVATMVCFVCASCVQYAYIGLRHLFSRTEGF